jgi:hypothetical protein
VSTIRSLDRMYANKGSQKVRELSSSELRQMLQEALRKENQPSPDQQPVSPGVEMGTSSGYVTEVFPHKSCFVYSQGAKNWMRDYSFDKDGNVVLGKARKESRQKWVEASADRMGPAVERARARGGVS